MNSEGIWSDFKPDKEHNNYESPKIAGTQMQKIIKIT